MFDLDGVPPHLRLNVVVADADGTVHDADDDLGAIKRRLAGVRLRPGSYTATLTAADAAGNRSRAQVLKFRVVGA